MELGADLGPIGAHGFLDFDALVHFQPHFTFEVDLGAGVSIEFEGDTIAGITLHLHLEGPAPWRAHGTGTFTFIFDKDFEVGPLQWGDATNPPPALVHPRDLVANAIGDAGRVADGPAGEQRPSRSILRVDPNAAALLVHPLGLFEVRQHAVPLETVIARVGANPVPPDETYVHFGLPQVNLVDVGAISEVTDLFSAGQFLNLTDDEKLSRPSFEPMQAGVRINPAAGCRFRPGSRAPERSQVRDIRDRRRRLAGRRLSARAAVKFSAQAPGDHARRRRRGPLPRCATRHATICRPDPITMADPGQTVIRGKSDSRRQRPVWQRERSHTRTRPRRWLDAVGGAPRTRGRAATRATWEWRHDAEARSADLPAVCLERRRS